MRRVRVVVCLLFVAALAPAACGTGASTTSGLSPSAGSGSGSFPVTVTQKLGEVTIEQRPTRVVALDFPSADAALALGVVPVGMQRVSYVDGGIQQWTRTALGGTPEPELIDTTGGFPLEQIARLRPDVILATNTYPPIAEVWDELNAIAPVVGHVTAPGQDTWQQGLRQVGTALGRRPAAERLVTEVEQQLTQTRRQHPEFAGKTVSIFNYAPASGGLYVINDESDFSIKFLRQLGFAGITDTVARLEGQQGRAQVSAERYNLLDADLVLGTSPDPAALQRLAAQPVFSRVPAVARGAYVPLRIGVGTALAFPSVLSVQYAIEEIVPRLARVLTRSTG